VQKTRRQVRVNVQLIHCRDRHHLMGRNLRSQIDRCFAVKARLRRPSPKGAGQLTGTAEQCADIAADGKKPRSTPALLEGRTLE